MDLNQIKPIARRCALSGEVFAPGSTVTCFLILAAGGELQRLDLGAQKAVGYEPPGRLLCRWTRQVKDPRDDAAAARRQALNSAEEIFLALASAPRESPEGEEQGIEVGLEEADVSVLRHLLALQLERKHVIRPVAGEPGWYLHGKSQTKVHAPSVAISPDRLLRLQDALSNLVP